MVRRVFLHLYMLRAPVVLVLFLGVVLPVAFGSPLFRGFADLEPNQIWFVSLASFLLLSTAMTCAFLVLLYGSERVDGKRVPAPPSLGATALPERLPLSGWIVGALYLIGGFFYLRFLYAVFQTMKSAHADPQGLFVSFLYRAALGILIGTAGVVVVFVLDLWISKPREAPQIEVFALPIAYLFRESTWMQSTLRKLSDSEPASKRHFAKVIALWKKFTLFLVRILGPGYGKFDANGTPLEINPGHEFAGMLELICIGLYLIAGAGGYRRLHVDGAFDRPRTYEAVLLQLILLLVLACWSLSGISFYFDRFRVPVLLPLALFLTATSRLGSSDHAFHTLTRNKTSEVALPTPQAKFMTAPDHIIAIAAAGGGIQAAAWTSQVLCGLRDEIGPTFDRNVVVISGVSGGSVGAMFYLRCTESSEGHSVGAEAATNSSLEAIAWGLAHPDLLHAILPLQNLWWAGGDRGWALERALRKNAQFQPPDRPLASRNAVEHWPVVLFNSTEARTGDPLVFTNSDFPTEVPSDQQNHRLHGFHRTYAGRDVNLETAVRMSAAFPYVSPAARSDVPCNAEHLVDGGYFDNSGIFSLGEWLKEATASSGPGLRPPSKRILVIQIDGFPDEQWNGPDDRPRSWAYQLVAPLSAVLHVRSEGQAVRDSAEGADLVELLTSRGQAPSGIVARYDPTAKTVGLGTSVTCATDPPLTWHLTEVEKLCIQQNWNDIKGDLATRVREFLTSPVKAAEPMPTRGQVRTEHPKQGLYFTEMVKP